MNQYEEEKREETTTILNTTVPHAIIPQCCRESWDDCPHKVQKPIVNRRNIGI